MNSHLITFLSCLFLFITVPVFGATVTVGPTDCSASTVNTAILGAAAGDVINLTCTGTVTWNSKVKLTGGKTLQGPGSFNASDAVNHGTWPLIIRSSVTSSAIIDVTCADSQQVNRVTGLKIATTETPTQAINVHGRGGEGAFRLDNLYFDNVKYSDRAIVIDGNSGPLNGVVDHNYFFASSGQALMSTYQSWRGGSLTCYGYDSLHRPVTWGNSDFVFFENNTFHNFGIDSAGEGTRYVVRYNLFESTETSWSNNPVDGHGADTKGHNCTGTVAGEIYENTVTGSKAYAQFVYARSGKWLIYNNTVAGGNIQLTEQRASSACSTQLDYPGYCTPACKQCPNSTTDVAGCYPLPNQVTGSYVWNNNGGTLMPKSTEPAYIASGRDYFTTAYSYAVYTYPHPLTLQKDKNTLLPVPRQLR